MTTDIRAALDAAEQHATFKIWAGHPLAIILEGLIKKIRAALNAEAPPATELNELFGRHCFEDDYGNKYLNAEAFESAVLELAAREALKVEPAGEGPTDNQLLAMRSWSSHGPTFDSDLVDFARNILSSRWCRPAAPPTPEPPAEALAARPLLEQVARLGDCIGANTVGQTMAISSRAAAWLEENPPGQPVAIEPRGCPTPGACSCVETATPAAPEVGEVEEVVAWIHRQAIHGPDADEWRRAATLLQQQQHLLKLACQELDNFMEQQQAAPAPPVVAPISHAERLRIVKRGITAGYNLGHHHTVEGCCGDPDEVAADYAQEVLEDLGDEPPAVVPVAEEGPWEREREV